MSTIAPASSASLAVDAHDSGSDTSVSEYEPLDVTKDDGWEDVEPDDETQPIVSLFSSQVFPDVQSMLRDCKDNYDFDFVQVQKDLDLDFFGTIKLVNYIRSEVKAGNSKPDVSSKSLFEDEKYMIPVLEDDALLYSLDEVSHDPLPVTGGNDNADPATRVQELEQELSRLRGEFAEYKNLVKKSLEKELSNESDRESSARRPREDPETRKFEQAEEGYFSSYSYNTIHESMLKDTIRTDAYRDFIYDNKSIFKDKVVLDVGCGTGILSMFCARAGAKMVIAVDNSDIIEKARQIVYENGFGHVIKCVRGKIEEVVLPVKQVDIIVSEWMGYCLLFEAMLDSVIWARDHYLAPDGLMVPSHATLRIAPFSDPDLIDEHVSFWNSVYGFKMSAMRSNIYDEVLIRHNKPSTVAAESALFLYLPLHSITVEELTFVKKFTVTISEDIESLDGWIVWFDIFFMPSRHSKIPADPIPSEMRKEDFVAFTTGPYGTETHWQQGVFLINRENKPAVPLKKGQVIEGQIGFRKKEDKSRLLDIDIQWHVEGVDSGRQEWSLQ
ncbi:hypothetical protein VTO42DRAFT_5874 [Malbranchea cinnamomea]